MKIPSFLSLIIFIFTSICFASESPEELSKKAILHFQNGDTLTSIPLFQKAYEICKEKYGLYNDDTMACLSNLALAFKNSGSNEEAISLLKIYSEYKKLKKGLNSQEVAAALDAIGDMYALQGNYELAVRNQNEVVNIKKKLVGHKNADTILSLNKLGQYFYEMGEYEKAHKILNDAFEKSTDSLGANHLTSLLIAVNLSAACRSLGQYEKSIQLCEKNAKISKKNLGSDHQLTKRLMNELGQCYAQKGQFDKGIQVFQELLENRKTADQNENLFYTKILNNLAYCYSEMGNHDKSIQIYKDILNTLAENSSNQLYKAQVLGNLGLDYAEIGDYLNALNMAEKSRAIYENILGEKSKQFGLACNNLALINSLAGKHVESIKDYRIALNIFTNILGEKHPEVGVVLSNIGNQLREIGQNEDAIIKLKKSVEIFEGSDVVNKAGALTNLGLAELDAGDLESSLKNLQQAISIYAKNFGPDHPRTLDALRALSGFYAQTGQYSQALAARHKILEICIKNYGQYNIKTTFAFADLGSAYSLNRDYKNSIENYEKAISTFTKLKIDNYYLQEIYEGTALSYYMIDQYHEATKYVLMSLNSRIKQLHNVLIADEKTRLEWHRKFSSAGIAPCFLPANLINKYTFFSKGLVFDSVAEDRAIAARGDGSGLLKQLESLRAEISQTTLNTNLKTDSNIEKLVFQSLQLENEISKFSTVAGRTRRSSIIKMEQTIDALPPFSCFINFIEFWDPKIQTPSSFVLGAILTLKEQDSIFIRIGEKASIHRSLRALRKAMNNGDSSGFDEQTSWLSEKLWAPIAAKIPQQVNRLIICPDGELNFLSFAALLDSDKKFLVEKYDISYMASARDLVRETKPETVRTLRLFANPTFQRDLVQVEDMQFAMRSAEVDVYGQLQLPPLPGTEKECAEIQKIASDAGWNLQTFTREQADEQTLRQTKKPGILHLATHGFYLNGFTPTPLDSRGMSLIGLEKVKLNTNGVDPMRASGIALAGAQSTLKSWSERKAPATEADGVLTAEEVAALDLDGTWLVTLSACETGVGEARSGEGVLGLRRSFMMAGAENLLMTLWPVSDQTTPEIMADFYREALKTGNAPGSLAKVQREWLVKLRKEKGLLEAVRDAGPFVMATIGKPLPPLPREPAKQESLLDKVGRKIEALIQSNNTDIKNN